MTCDDVRARLLDRRRRRLAPADDAEVRAHLRECTACTREDEADALLDDLLARNLPRHAAPPALKRRLDLIAAAAGDRAPPARPRGEWARRAAPALAAGVALFAAGAFTGTLWRPGARAGDMLASEAVSDHLRLLVSEHPLDMASNGTHDVKPWLAARLDFAPVVPRPDVPELVLDGGGVGWFLDRRAALVSYHLRKHRVTMVAFREDGLACPASGAQRDASLRGFHVALWRAGGLCYALVSDVNAPELRALAARFAAEAGP